MPVVLFDELGLAETSPHKPLKVLHKYLDKALNIRGIPPKFSFVGISNWELDVSKMNRVIFVGKPDLDKNDLILTGKELLEAYNIKDNIK